VNLRNPALTEGRATDSTEIESDVIVRDSVMQKRTCVRTNGQSDCSGNGSKSRISLASALMFTATSRETFQIQRMFLNAFAGH